MHRGTWQRATFTIAFAVAAVTAVATMHAASIHLGHLAPAMTSAVSSTGAGHAGGGAGPAGPSRHPSPGDTGHATVVLCALLVLAGLTTGAGPAWCARLAPARDPRRAFPTRTPEPPVPRSALVSDHP